MRYFFICLYLTACSDFVFAMLPDEPGNRVSFSQFGGINFKTDSIGPLANRVERVFDHEARPGFPFGRIEAHGIADWGVLKLKGLLSGTGLGGFNLLASTVDIFTINNPNIAIGTAGTITAYMNWDGSARVLDANGDVINNREHPNFGTSHVRATLTIAQNEYDPMSGSAIHNDTDTVFPATTGVVVTPQVDRLLAATVHFEYGVPFPLQLSLGVSLASGVTLSGPVMGQFTARQSNFYDEVATLVEANYFNTATLVALVGDGNNRVTGTSNYDYQSLVTTVPPSPVPLPGTLIFMLSGLVITRSAMRTV